MESNNLKLRFGFLGGGNMAKAIFQGMVKADLVRPDQTYVSARSEATVDYWNSLGAIASQCNYDVIRSANVIFVCVKPLVVVEVLTEIYKRLEVNLIKAELILSVMAGTSLETLKQLFAGFRNIKIIRVMPNTPVMVGSGCTIYAPGPNVGADDTMIVEKIFNTCGTCTRMPEALFSAAGALTSSGPAFIYIVIEALADGGVKMGLPRDIAYKFAAQMVTGSAQMVLHANKHPGQLKDDVCSAGGTTIAGVHTLETLGLRNCLISAIESSALKSTEMSNSLNKIEEKKN